MSLDRLKKVLKPPRVPVFPAKSRDWKTLERGGNLPEDYKSLVACYGAGVIDDFINVLSPSAGPGQLDILERARIFQRVIRDLPAGYTPPVLGPDKLYPESSSGLFPFGFTYNGDELLLQRDSGRGWSSVLLVTPDIDVCEYHMSISAFLLKLLVNDIRGISFPQEFPSKQPVFHPGGKLER